MMLAEKAFELTEQKSFALVSGDYNPMHMDALVARRTQAGAPVVHGIHLLLWALDSFAASQDTLPSLKALRVQFNTFVYLGERARVTLERQTAKGTRLTISVDGSSRIKIAIEFGEFANEDLNWADAVSEPAVLFESPLDLTFEEMSGRSGRLPFAMSPGEAERLFPAAASWLGSVRIAAIVATTYLVGMVCPGLHSIYGELSIAGCSVDLHPDTLAYRVTEADPRFHSVELQIIGGGITGLVQTFARTPPVSQATLQSMRSVVSPNEFSGSLALIVGGSRGLGELTAKLVAAGGGRVVITWQSGKEDAERVAQEIRSAGGECETLAYDARKPAEQQLEALAGAPTHAYYFATPVIFRPQSSIFKSERFAEFLDVYVDGFWRFCQALRERRPGISVYYPSSVSVTERPQGMTEYSMAKAAGEILCEDINQYQAPTRVTVSRLPRLPTDQTATVTSVETAQPIDILLPIVREVQSWPR